MADETTPTVPATPDGALNTDTNAGQSVPYDRFREVNEARKAAEVKLAELQAAQKKAEEEALKRRGEFETLYNDLKPKAERADVYESIIKGLLDDELKTIPESMRNLVIGADAAAQLAWIRQAKAAGLFTRTPAPNLDAGVQGDSKPRPVQLTPEQQRVARSVGMTDEQYIAAMLKTQGV